MPESKEQALARAKKLGFPASQVVKSDKGGYFIAPEGVTAPSAKTAYANCRATGKAKSECARISHVVQKNHEAKAKK